MDGTKSPSVWSVWLWPGALAAGALLMPFTYQGEVGGEDLVSTFLFSAAIAMVAILSGILRSKVPDSPFGWLLLATALGLTLGGTSGLFIPEARPDDPTFVTYAAVVFQNTLGVYTLFYPFALILYLFPTGKFMSKKWTWAGWYGVIFIPAVFFSGLFADDLPAPFGGLWSIPNPIGFIPSAVAEVVSGFAFFGLVVVMLGGIVAIVTRYRRSSLLIKTQVKWLAYPGVVFVLAYITIVADLIDNDSPVWSLVFVVPFLLIPIGITIAITRYRLFEIDRLISRTVSYTLVVGVLGAVFAIGAIWLPATIVGERQPIFVAGSTLVVASLFNPLRLRLQRLVDRRFNRSAYEAELLADDFTTTLQDSLTVDELASEWEGTVETALEPGSIGVWLSPSQD